MFGCQGLDDITAALRQFVNGTNPKPDMILLTFNVAALSEPIDKITGDIADDILVVAAENNPPDVVRVFSVQ